MTRADALRAVFTPEVLCRLSNVVFPSDSLRLRLEIITACSPQLLTSSADWLEWLQARRAAWEAYLQAALAFGLFDGYGGDDLSRRLTGTDDDNFRSAMAECMACCFLSSRLNLPVTPRPEGRSGKVPDLCITSEAGDITIEVKAPFAARSTEAWWGDKSRLVADAIDNSNRQFAHGRANVLLIVAPHENPFFANREDLVRALFGDEDLVIKFNRQTLESVGHEVRFSPSGKFLKTWGEAKPRFTKISAVIRLREHFVADVGERGNAKQRIEPRWLVLHNPFCPIPVPREIWGDCPQFIVDGDVMRWTDGRSIYG